MKKARQVDASEVFAVMSEFDKVKADLEQACNPDWQWDFYGQCHQEGRDGPEQLGKLMETLHAKRDDLLAQVARIRDRLSPDDPQAAGLSKIAASIADLGRPGRDPSSEVAKRNDVIWNAYRHWRRDPTLWKRRNALICRRLGTARSATSARRENSSRFISAT